MSHWDGNEFRMEPGRRWVSEMYGDHSLHSVCRYPAQTHHVTLSPGHCYLKHQVGVPIWSHYYQMNSDRRSMFGKPSGKNRMAAWWISCQSSSEKSEIWSSRMNNWMIRLPSWTSHTLGRYHTAVTLGPGMAYKYSHPPLKNHRFLIKLLNIWFLFLSSLISNLLVWISKIA